MQWLDEGGGSGGGWKAEGCWESEKKEARRGRCGWEEEEWEEEGQSDEACVRVEAGACGAAVGRGGRKKPPLGPAGRGGG